MPRRAHPSDGRVGLIEATEKGLALVLQLRPVIHAEARRWLSCLAEEELEKLRVSIRSGPTLIV